MIDHSGDGKFLSEQFKTALASRAAVEKPVRPCGHRDCSTSSNIAEILTFGRGKLDEAGLWEIPCDICARAFEAKHPESAPCWPFTEAEARKWQASFQ